MGEQASIWGPWIYLKVVFRECSPHAGHSQIPENRAGAQGKISIRLMQFLFLQSVHHPTALLQRSDLSRKALNMHVSVLRAQGTQPPPWDWGKPHCSAAPLTIDIEAVPVQGEVAQPGDAMGLTAQLPVEQLSV